MKKAFLAIAAVLALLLSACGEQQIELPMPTEVYAAIESGTEIDGMIDVADDFLMTNLGIGEGEYESAVYYITAIGDSCEEIIIVKAKDESGADVIYEKLEGRLEYIEKSAQNYLTEYLPMIASAELRRDGLTLSLIVSPHVEQIKAIYESYR